MLPTSSELIYFLQVAKTLNITQAARLLGITQPTLTLAIKRLEHSLGAEIFIRTKKGLSLTEEGKILYRQTKNLLSAWEALEGEVRDHQNFVKGKIILGAHHSVALYILPLFLPQLLEQHPLLEIDLIHDLSRKITEKVVGLELDMGLVINPIAHPDLVMLKLGVDTVTLYTSSKHPLSHRILCDPLLFQAQDVLKKLGKTKSAHYPMITTSSLEVAAELCSQGLGQAILPGRVAKHHQHLGLKIVENSPRFHDEIYLIYRVEKKGNPAVSAISKLVKKSFK